MAICIGTALGVASGIGAVGAARVVANVGITYALVPALETAGGRGARATAIEEGIWTGVILRVVALDGIAVDDADAISGTVSKAETSAIGTTDSTAAGIAGLGAVRIVAKVGTLVPSVEGTSRHGC